MNFLKRFQYARDSYIVTALIIAIALLVNFIASRHFVRVDLTRSQMYAISDTSKDLMRNLDDIVTVKVYFSEVIPPYLFSVRQYVDDVLEELSSYSKGRLQVISLNPDNPDTANEAVKMGIPQVQMNIIDKDKLEVKNGFLGIAVLYGDKKEVLPVVQNMANVEYDLVSAIKKVTAKQEKTVGFVTGHGEPSISEDIGVGTATDSYSALKKSLDRNYQVREVTLKDEHSLDGIDTLMVAGSKTSFSDTEKFLIDQFVMKGGNLVVLADSVGVALDLQTTPQDLALSDLLENYGASFDKTLVLDRSNESASFNQGFMNFIIPYPFWVKAINSFFDSSSPIVNKLDNVVFPWISPLKLVAKDGVTAQVLAKTTPNAWTQSDPFNLAPNLIQGSSEKSQYPLVVLLKGGFISFFKDKKLPLETKDFISSSSKPGKIFLVGNSRFATDRFVSMFPQNMAFLMNAVDDLTLDQSLIAIRSKSVFELPLKDLSATQRELVIWTGILLMPILVVLYGIARFVVRKRHPYIP
jgi:ABC-2 type transport system permease protein